jgi:hypothetical protein
MLFPPGDDKLSLMFGMHFAAILKLLLGIVMLVRGSKLFWFFLGCVGFIFAFDFSQHNIHGKTQALTLAIALFAGIIGAVAAVLLQKFTVLIAGFFAGGYLLTELPRILGLGVGSNYWILFVIGGIIGAVLMNAMFNWALIIFSSLIGAALIVETLHLGHQTSALVFIGLGIVGIVVQSGFFLKKVISLTIS